MVYFSCANECLCTSYINGEPTYHLLNAAVAQRNFSRPLRNYKHAIISPVTILLMSYIAVFFCIWFKGKSLVPEQADEMEAGKRRAAGSRCPREGTGERQKGHAPSLRAFWHWRSQPPAHRGLTSKRRQPRQRPQLWACALMIRHEGVAALFSGKTR